MYYNGMEMIAKILSDGQICVRVLPRVSVSLDEVEVEAAKHAREGSLVVDQTARTVTFQPLPLP
jgi:hypothetical protein